MTKLSNFVKGPNEHNKPTQNFVNKVKDKRYKLNNKCILKVVLRSNSCDSIPRL